MSRRLAVVLAGAAAAVAALVIALGDGGSGGEVVGDPIARAADATAAAGPAEIGIAGTIAVGRQTISMTGRGVIDAKRSVGRLTLATATPAAGQVIFEEILSGEVMYVKMPAGKRWVMVELDTARKVQGVDVAQLLRTSPGGRNPADLLGYLKDVTSARVVGHERISGKRTTHYRGKLDLGSAVGRKVKRLNAKLGLEHIPVDVWVDKSHRVRRERIAFVGSGSRAGAFLMNMTIDFLRFGVQVDAEAPPGDQVFEQR